MNPPLVNIIRKRFPLIASAVLIGLGVALVASALRAQAQPKTTAAKPIPYCFIGTWPPQDSTEKQNLVDAFNQALSDCATGDSAGSALRTQLLDPRNNFKAPRDAMRAKLKKVHPESKINIPDEVIIIFYEEETDKAHTAAEQTKAIRAAFEHPNHCYIVVYLEPLNRITTTTPSLGNQMMCCYDPY